MVIMVKEKKYPSLLDLQITMKKLPFVFKRYTRDDDDDAALESKMSFPRS